MHGRLLLVAASWVLLSAAAAQPKGASHSRDGESKVGAKSCPEDMSLSEKWETSDFVGFTLRLVDPKRVLVFSFKENGNAMTTAGQAGGPLTAPILTWRVDQDGVLHVEDVGTGRIHFTIRKQCSGDRGFIVNSNGTREEFGKERK
jgi:hypothetical protein